MNSATCGWMDGWMDGWMGSGAEPVSCSGGLWWRRSARNHEGKKGQKCHQSNIQYLYLPGSLTWRPNQSAPNCLATSQNCRLCDVFDTSFLFFTFFFFYFKHKSLANVGSLCVGFRFTGHLLFYSATLILKVTRPRNLSLSSLLRRSEPSTLHSTGSSLL